MSESAQPGSDSSRKALRTRLYEGRPLTSRTKWLAIKAIYVLACMTGAAAVIAFLDGMALAVGLTIMAFLVGGIIELFALRYDDYRMEWEMANREDASES